jgi:hypothetical protein
MNKNKTALGLALFLSFAMGANTYGMEADIPQAHSKSTASLSHTENVSEIINDVKKNVKKITKDLQELEKMFGGSTQEKPHSKKKHKKSKKPKSSGGHQDTHKGSNAPADGAPKQESTTPAVVTSAAASTSTGAGAGAGTTETTPVVTPAVTVDTTPAGDTTVIETPVV